MNSLTQFVLKEKRMSNETILVFSLILKIYHRVSSICQSSLQNHHDVSQLLQNYLIKKGFNGARKDPYLIKQDKNGNIFENDIQNIWELIFKMKEAEEMKSKKAEKLVSMQGDLLNFFNTLQFFLLYLGIH